MASNGRPNARLSRPDLTASEVRAVLPRSEISKAWAWKSGHHVEFHGPGDFYWHGRGCCLWHARAEGWILWLKRRSERE